MKNLNILFLFPFLFILLSVTVLFGDSVKLEIVKSAAPQYIEGNRTIHYTLSIQNTSNSVTYDPITINDDMEDGLFSDANITITNNGGFTCDVNTSDTDSEITCVGSIGPDRVKFIEYDVIAPNEGRQVTNNASVYYGDDEINTASITITVFPNYDGNLDYNRDVCYVTLPSEGVGCKQSGAFTYGPDCTNSIRIEHNSTLGTLSNLHVFKSYTSSIESTDCYTDPGEVSCGEQQTLEDLLHLQTSLYFEAAFNEAHDFSLGNFLPDENRTIVDINTIPVSGHGSNLVTSFEYIALIAQYNLVGDDTNTDTNTIEEYIYPCGGGGYVPPPITQLTGGGVNDVNLLNEDITLENALYIKYGSDFDSDEYDKVGTKIVNQPFLLGVTYLDADGNAAVYNGAFGSSGKIINAAILLLYESDHDAPGVEPRPIWSGELTHNTSNILTLENFSNDEATQDPYPIIREAARSGKITIQLIDYGSFFVSVDGLNCAQSSLESSLCLLPACLNSATQILNVFPLENYPHVATCIYGDGGGASPCDSNAYTGNCGGKKLTISPEKYDHDLGCMHCLADAVAPFRDSSPFSTRPRDFSLDVLGGVPSLYDAEVRYKAGAAYTIDLNATTRDDSITQSPYYNTTLEGYHPPEVIAVIGLEEDPSLTCPYDDNESQTIIFSNGYSVGPISYSNVGKTKLVIMDQNWTSIDKDTSVYSTPRCIIDSNETNPVLDPLGLGRVGCKIITEKTLTFIPDHFNIDANLTDHNSDQNFTYLHDINKYDNANDNHSMAAELNISILAMNFNDTNITTNYIKGCYAKDTNLTLDLGGDSITYPGTIPALTKFIYYNPVEDDGTNDGEGEHNFTTPITSPISIASLPIENIDATFPAQVAPDANGTTHIQYKLNFDRKQNLVVNPFKIVLNDINITDDDSVTEIDGTETITHKNATLYYARSRASKFFYEDITTTNTPTPIIIDVYCGLPTTSDCSDLGISTVSGKIFEDNWYVSTGHTSSDGNITLMVGDPLIEGTGSPSIYSVADTTHRTNPTPTDITTWTNGADGTVTVDSEGAAVPLTVPIKIVRESDTPTPATYSNEWLIYNPDDPIPLDPFYKVRFIGNSSWTGTGITGDVVNINASRKKSKRMDW